MKLLSDQDLKYEIISCREVLKDLTGQEVLHWCYCRGRYDERVLKVVKEAGYKYGRTTKLGVGGDNFEQKCYHCFQRPEYNGEEWFNVVKKAFDENEGKIHIWGHCFEFERDLLWERLEELFKYITKKEDNNLEIGYIEKKSHIKNGVKVIDDIDLLEVSLVKNK